MKLLGQAVRASSRSGLTGYCRRLHGLAAFVSLCACQASTVASRGKGADALQRRETQVTHARCDIEASTVKSLDANGDGRAEVTVAQADHGLCRAYDLNLDGGIDSWVYEDGSGRLLRRELDFDRDGVPDETQLFVAGSPSERHLSTTVPGRLDTWHIYRAGKIIRTERDTNGDSIIDQWWVYPTPDCPVIQSDTDADGKPNPDSAIDLCKLGEVPPGGRREEGHPEARTFERPGTSPTEVEPNAEPNSTEGSEGSAESNKATSASAKKRGSAEPTKSAPVTAKPEEPKSPTEPTQGER